MHTAIALCYFCENHGPRIVVTCQPMRNSELPRTNGSKMEEKSDKYHQNIPSGKNIKSPRKILDKFWFAIFLNIIILILAVESDGSEARDESEMEDLPEYYGDLRFESGEVVDDEQRCAACSSFEHGMGMLSNDHEAEISYVSTQVEGLFASFGELQTIRFDLDGDIMENFA